MMDPTFYRWKLEWGSIDHKTIFNIRFAYTEVVKFMTVRPSKIHKCTLQQGNQKINIKTGRKVYSVGGAILHENEAKVLSLF